MGGMTETDTQNTAPVNDASTQTPAPPPTTPAPEPTKKSSALIPLLILLVLTLVGAGWYILKNRNAPPESAPVTMNEPKKTPLFLTITSPQGEATAVNGEILVSGKTLPGTTVVIYTDTDDTSLESDAQGNFESSVVVGTKGGLVRITAYGDSEEKSETLNISASNP